jgi:hypothetical protein
MREEIESNTSVDIISFLQFKLKDVQADRICQYAVVFESKEQPYLVMPRVAPGALV